MKGRSCPHHLFPITVYMINLHYVRVKRTSQITFDDDQPLKAVLSKFDSSL